MKKVLVAILFLQFFSRICFAQIPDLYIYTQDSKTIASKTEWVQGKGSLKKSSDDFENITLSIKGRGNSTWTNVLKKPYTIKLDKKRSILGMAEDSRWILLANYFDNSFIKNDVAFELARILEMEYVPQGKFVNLYLNDRYRGLYYICEQIRVGKNRVNISNKKDYLLELDDFFDEQWKFRSSKGLPYQIKNDSYMTEQRLAFIFAKVRKIEEKLYSPYFPYADEKHKKLDLTYKRYIDTESFIKFWLVQEITNNYDPNHPRSVYMTYTAKGGQFSLGPVWDFDWSLVNKNASLWKCKSSLYYEQLFKSPDFVENVKKIWKEYYPQLMTITAYVDEVSGEIKKEALRDRNRWPLYEKNSWSPGYIDLGGYEKEVAFVKSALKSRLEWMNKEINKMK